MACNCGKNKKQYFVNHPDGKTTQVGSLSEAITVARRTGGSYERRRVAS